ncbi:hypothetical protein [Streptomyces goshikiensis]|uniref:hypothetical protein n=1 Tax=Streptomyces goshikiensis TaxID=1942 RepID=UPI0033BDFA45
MKIFHGSGGSGYGAEESEPSIRPEDPAYSRNKPTQINTIGHKSEEEDAKPKPYQTKNQKGHSKALPFIRQIYES